MGEIVWSESLSVGVAEVDLEHQRLIGFLNDLGRAMAQGRGREILGPILVGLVDYTQTHFAHEESLLRAHGYPAFAEHKRAHDELTRRVNEVQAAYDAGDTSVATAVSEFLSTWLTHHICEMDRAYVPFLRSKGVQ